MQIALLPPHNAYDHFRLERQGNRVSPKTLLTYDYHLGRFFDWLRRERPDIRRVEVGALPAGFGSEVEVLDAVAAKYGQRWIRDAEWLPDVMARHGLWSSAAGVRK